MIGAVRERAELVAGRAWWRAVVDVGLVAIAAVDALPGTAPAWSAGFVSSVVAVIALLWRRRWPLVTWLLCLPVIVLGNALVAPLVALFTVADRVRRPWLVGLAVASALGCEFAAWLGWWPASESLAVSTMQAMIYAVVLAGGPTALGLLLRARRRLGAQLERLVASQAREQALVTEAVLATERTRLAREMHDVVSHQVSLIALQSGALRVTAADHATVQAAATIRTLAVKTLDELRVMVGVLRGRAEDQQLAPQPRLADLDRLVGDSQTGAVLSLDGVAARPWPEPLERAAYRTVQEGLTNIGKHAAGAAARVEISAAGRTLVVKVSNGPPPAPRRAGRAGEFPVSGHGLIGLRERAELFGGQLTTRATTDGGFELCATFRC